MGRTCLDHGNGLLSTGLPANELATAMPKTDVSRVDKAVHAVVFDLDRLAAVKDRTARMATGDVALGVNLITLFTRHAALDVHVAASVDAAGTVVPLDEDVIGRDDRETRLEASLDQQRTATGR